MTVTLERRQAPPAGAHGRLGADVLDVFRALLWRRLHRLGPTLRNPQYLFGIVGMVAFAVFLVANIPVHTGRSSHGTQVTGALFLLNLGLTPFFSRRAGFHIPAPREDAQWILTASGGANAYLLERMGFRVALSVTFAGIGLGGAAAVGSGRPPGAAVILLCVAALNSLVHGALGTIAFKLIRSREPSVALQVGLFSTWVVLIGVCAGNLGGSGALVAPFGQLVEGRTTAAALIGLVCLAVFSAAVLAVEQSNASWFIEPMAEAGILREQDLPAERKKPGRTAKSWDGLPRLRGSASLVWTGLVVERRYYRRTLIQDAVFLGIAAGAVSFTPHRPLYALIAPLWASYAMRITVRPNPSRDEYFHRAPYPLWRVVAGYLFRPFLQFGTIALLAWIPAAFIWNRGTAAYLSVGLAALVFYLLLTISLTYAQMIEPAHPSLSFLVRIPMPVVVAIGWVLVYETVDAGLAGIVLTVALTLGILGFFRAIIDIIETT